jgi:hypothetical protein
MTAGASVHASRVVTSVRAVALAALIGCIAAAPRPSAASCPYPVQADLHGEYWTDATVPIPLPFHIPLVTVDVCQPSFEVGKFGASLTIGDSNNGISADFGFSLQDAVFDLIPLIDDGFAPPDDISTNLQCTVSLRDTMAHVSGGANTYAFHIGGGGPFGQRVWGTIRMCDQIVIDSSVPASLELPVHVSASVVTAESFGDPNQTYGIARVCLSGSAAGVGIGGACLADTSVSVIPTPRDLDVSQTIPIDVVVGRTIVPVDMVAEIESKSQAKSTGLFGIISGAATAGVSLPGSLFIGNIRGAGGTAIPPGILIQSDSTGFVYADTRTVDVSGPASPRSRALTLANPYRAGSPIMLGMTAAGARARIVDLAGRRVRDLGPCGDRVVWTWDGRDDGGAAVRSGMYFVMATWSQGSAQRPFVLIR